MWKQPIFLAGSIIYVVAAAVSGQHDGNRGYDAAELRRLRLLRLRQNGLGGNLHASGPSSNKQNGLVDVDDEGMLATFAEMQAGSLPPPTPRPTTAKPAMTKRPTPKPIKPTKPPQMKTPRPTRPPVETPRPTRPPVKTPRPTRAPVQTTRPTEKPVRTPRPTRPSTTPPTDPTTIPTPRPTRQPPSTLGPTESPTTGGGDSSVWDIIESRGRLSTLATAISAADLQDEFATTSPFTAFGPINSAFRRDLGDDYAGMLVSDDAYGLHLNSMVLNHGTGEGSLLSSDLTDGQRFESLAGEDIDVIVNETGVFLVTFAVRLEYTGAIQVTRADSVGTNGVLHEIGEVLSPAWFFIDLMDILDILSNRFSTLTQLIVAAGLENAVANTPNTTLAAPTNDAFAALPNRLVNFLTDPANVEVLRQVLLYHLIPVVINFAAMDLGETPEPTFQGEDVTVRVDRAQDGSLDVFFNDAEASIFFLTKWNIMYQLDNVLVPPGFDPFEQNSPPNPAETPVPTSAPIVDITPDTTIPAVSTPVPGETTVLGLIESDPKFSTLVTAVEAAELGSFLESDAFPSTLFAPPNAAFDVIGPDYLGALLTPPYNLHLLSIVYYHVLFDKDLPSADMKDGDVLNMLNQLQVTVQRNDVAPELQLTTSSIMNGLTPIVNLTNPDNIAENGVVHEVDSVIFPFWYFRDTLSAIRALDGTFDNFFAILNALELEEFVEGLTEVTIFGPDNGAFANLPQPVLDFLSNRSNFDVLQEVVEYHVIPNLVPFTELGVGDFVFETLQGESVTMTVGEPDGESGQLLSVNGVPISTFWLAKESIVYELTGLLVPQSVAEILPAAVGSTYQDLQESPQRVYATRTEGGEPAFVEYSSP